MSNSVITRLSSTEWKRFALFLVFECALPMCPVGIEYFVYGVLGLSDFQFYDKSLAVSAMMVPMVAFLKSEDFFTKLMFAIAALLGVAMLAVVLTLNAKHVTIQVAVKEKALSTCYNYSLFVVGVVLSILVLINLFSDIILPFRAGKE